MAAENAVPSEFQVADWRRAVGEMYADVRREADPAQGHALWRARRDELFRTHPQSPLPVNDRMRETGLPYWPYDAALRYELPLAPADRLETLPIETAADGRIELRLLGSVAIAELGFRLDVWWLAQYGGGIFLPLRDGTAGRQSYGGGRYLLDTVKGADLGGDGSRIVVDLNFLYHPSCRYSPAWDCPLAPAGNTTSVAVRAGERM